jgi:hypothetical protein
MNSKVLNRRFRLTSKAEHYLEETIAALLKNESLENHVPVITWIGSEYKSNGEEVEIIPGPTIGFENRSDFLKKHTQYYETSNYKIPIALDKKRINECQIKILDFRLQKLILIFEDDLDKIDIFDYIIK